ncbi:MAG: hypothetical protein GF331_22670 [Chitinivibrionales bacterium]|nr:hypothetical protein [Chitinivibrionales bacterium]
MRRVAFVILVTAGLALGEAPASTVPSIDVDGPRRVRNAGTVLAAVGAPLFILGMVMSASAKPDPTQQASTEYVAFSVLEGVGGGLLASGAITIAIGGKKLKKLKKRRAIATSHE